MDGRIGAAGPLALADQLPILIIVKRGWSGFVPVRRAIYEPLALALAQNAPNSPSPTTYMLQWSQFCF